VADAGWAWGAQFGDLNNEGLLDLFVAKRFYLGRLGTKLLVCYVEDRGCPGQQSRGRENWPPIGSASLSGYERSRVLLNRGQRGSRTSRSRPASPYLLDGRAVAMATCSIGDSSMS